MQLLHFALLPLFFGSPAQPLEIQRGGGGICSTQQQHRIVDCTRIIHGRGEAEQNRAFSYNDRGIAPYIETIALNAKYSYACNCGFEGQPKRRAIAHYTESIMQDPKDDDAYFRCGIENLYAGSLANALADIGRAGELDPKYPYYALWLEILEMRGNLASRLREAVRQIDMTKWPAPVIRLFLGQETPAAVLAAADDPDSETRKGQICEANFYSGEWALQRGSKDEAVRLFRLAAADCPQEDFVEGPAANAELNALGQSTR